MLELIVFSMMWIAISAAFNSILNNLILSAAISLAYIWFTFTVTCLVHESGHYLVFRWYGVDVKCVSIGNEKCFFKRVLFEFYFHETLFKIYILPTGGYVLPFGYGWRRLTPFQDAMISFAGPFADFIFSMACLPLMIFSYYRCWELAFLMFSMLWFMNLLTAIVNLLPIFNGSDGSNIWKIIRSWLRSRKGN